MEDNMTIRDVAKAAEVSVSTASRALNNNPRISLKTRDQIRIIADQLGYHTNQSAKTLALGESNTVGVIFPVGSDEQQNNAFFVNILRGINNNLMPRKWVTAIAMGHDEEQLIKNVRSMVEQGLVKKFIFLATREHDAILEYLQQRVDVRYVVIGQPYDEGVTLFVDNDNYLVGKQAIEGLLEVADPKRVAVISSNRQTDFEQLRKRAIQDVAHERNVELFMLDAQFEGDDEKIDAFLDQYEASIDGIIGTDDDMAALLLTKFIQRHQHLVPTMGINNTWLLKNVFGDNFHSIELYPQRLGNQATELLFGPEDSKGILISFGMD